MSYKILTKGCTRCGGDLFLEREGNSFYLACIQCGAVENQMTRLLQMRFGSQRVSGDKWRKRRKPVEAGERCQ